MKKLFIIGSGPTAAEVYSFVTKHKLFEIAGFAEYAKDKTVDELFGLPMYEVEKLDDVINKDEDYVFAAMFWDHLNEIRRKMYMDMKERGYKIATLISPDSITNDAEIGENCLISDNAYIKPFAKIGDNTYLDTGSFVGIGSEIGSHCYLAAKSLVAGYCKVGNQSFIGLNATLFDHTNVGNLCVVGATMSVKRDVPDCSVVKGSNDNTIVKSYPQEIMTEKLVAAKNVRE